jgi:predicted alpha/beta superfamily hydrolase
MKPIIIFSFLLFFILSCVTQTSDSEASVMADKPLVVGNDIFSLNMVMEELFLESEEINDTYKIDISYLGKPDPSVSYPVVYITDGNWRRNDHKYVHYLNAMGIIPPVIAVGIGYPQNYYPNEIRERDLFQAQDEFYSFITEQVIPFVEAKYNCDPAQRIYFGASLGGCFGTYIFLKNSLSQDDTFSSFICSSSWLRTNEISQLEQALAVSGLDVPYNLYMTYGADEEYYNFEMPNMAFFDLIDLQDYKDLNFIHYKNPGKDHYTNTRPTLADGLKLFLGQGPYKGIGFIDLSKNTVNYDFTAGSQIYDWFYDISTEHLAVNELALAPPHDTFIDRDAGAMIATCEFTREKRAGIIGTVFDHFEDLSEKNFTFTLHIPGELANKGLKIKYYFFSTYNWKMDIIDPGFPVQGGWNTFMFKLQNDNIKGDTSLIRGLGLILELPESTAEWKGNIYTANVSWE